MRSKLDIYNQATLISAEISDFDKVLAQWCEQFAPGFSLSDLQEHIDCIHFDFSELILL